MIEIAAMPSEQSRIQNESYKDLPHVLMVLDEFPKALGGAEQIALKSAALLPRYGYRASILAFHIYPGIAELKSPACPVYQLPIRKTYDLKAIRAALELGRFLKEQNVQIVHTFFESSDLWAGLVTKTLSNAKLIWARRDMGILRGRKHNIAYKAMANAPDAVFAVSEQVRQHCINVDGIKAERVQTIYNGLSLSDWTLKPRPDKPAGEALITTVGHIRRVKGHDVLIKAAGLIAPRFPGVNFSIAGDVLEPDYFGELVALVKELNLTGRFRFDGGVSNLREHLAGADIFVLPSRSEGFSNAIVEAMAASLPAVVTNVGGNAEAVEDGETGYVVPSDDPEALAEAIVSLLSDPARAREMGAAGKRVAGEKFTIEAMIDQTTASYSRILSRK